MNESGEIFAVFTIIKTEDGVNSTLGIDFAPMLNKAKVDGIEEVILCQNINGLFVSSTDNQYILNMQLDKVPAVDGMQITESKLLGCPWVILIFVRSIRLQVMKQRKLKLHSIESAIETCGSSDIRLHFEPDNVHFGIFRIAQRDFFVVTILIFRLFREDKKSYARSNIEEKCVRFFI